MNSVYVFSSGSLMRRNNSIAVESDGILKYLPVETVKEIRIFGNISVNRRFLELLNHHEIFLHYFKANGIYYGSFIPEQFMSSGEVLKAQFRCFNDFDCKRMMAKKIFSAAAGNMVYVAKHFAANEKNVSDIETVKEVEFESFDFACERAEKIFIDAFGDEEVLRFVYKILKSFLVSSIFSSVAEAGLEDRFGFIHEGSLSLDLTEVFAPIVGGMFLQKINKSKGFLRSIHITKGGFSISQEALKIMANEFERILRTSYFDENFGRNVSLRNYLQMEVYKIKKSIAAPERYSGFMFYDVLEENQVA